MTSGKARARSLYDWSVVIPQYLEEWNRSLARCESRSVVECDADVCRAHLPTIHPSGRIWDGMWCALGSRRVAGDTICIRFSRLRLLFSEKMW